MRLFDEAGWNWWASILYVLFCLTAVIRNHAIIFSKVRARGMQRLTGSCVSPALPLPEPTRDWEHGGVSQEVSTSGTIIGSLCQFSQLCFRCFLSKTRITAVPTELIGMVGRHTRWPDRLQVPLDEHGIGLCGGQGCITKYSTCIFPGGRWRSEKEIDKQLNAASWLSCSREKG